MALTRLSMIVPLSGKLSFAGPPFFSDSSPGASHSGKRAGSVNIVHTAF